MGIITCEGRLTLNRLTMRTATAVARGKISDRDPPRQKFKSETQFILSIYYPKYYALQRNYLDLGHPEVLRQPLRSFGMTDEGIAHLEETAEVRSTVNHGCPSRFRVTYVAERGTEVERGALLFEYGEVAILAHLPKRIVQYLEPGTKSYAYPQNWPSAGTPEGRRLAVRVAHVDEGVYSDHVVYFSTEGTCPDYMINSSFNLQFEILDLPDGPAIINKTKPVDKSVRPDSWLPPRGVYGGYLTLYKIDKQKAELASTKTGAIRHSIPSRAQPDPVPDLIKNGVYKFPVGPEHLPAIVAPPDSKVGSAAGNAAVSALVQTGNNTPRSRRKSRKVAIEPRSQRDESKPLRPK